MKNLIIIFCLVFSSNLFAQYVVVTGNWMKIIAPSDISEAGNDYATAFTSNADQTLLTIDPKNKNKLVYVYVTKSDIAWHNNLTLKIRHTSNNNSINNGSAYQIITNSQTPVTPLFSWNGDYITIPLQYEITGISVLLPVQSYATTIIFTVMQP